MMVWTVRLVAASVLWASASVACGAQQASQRVGDPVGRWLIVPMPNGIRVEPSPTAQPGVWRLDTQTGDLQFCYYSGAGDITCSIWDKPPSLRLYKSN